MKRLIIFLFLFLSTSLSAEYVIGKKGGDCIIEPTKAEFNRAYTIINTYQFPMYVYNEHISEEEKTQLDENEHRFIEAKVKEVLGSQFCVEFIPQSLYEFFILQKSIQEKVKNFVVQFIKEGFLQLNEEQEVYFFNRILLPLVGNEPHLQWYVDPYCKAAFSLFCIPYLRQYIGDLLKRALPLLGLSPAFQDWLSQSLSDVEGGSVLFPFPLKEDAERCLEGHSVEKCPDDLCSNGNTHFLEDFQFNYKENFRKALENKRVIAGAYELNSYLFYNYPGYAAISPDFFDRILSSFKRLCEICLMFKEGKYSPLFSDDEKLYIKVVDIFSKVLMEELDHPTDYFLYRGGRYKGFNDVKARTYSFGTMLGGYFCDSALIGDTGACAGLFAAFRECALGIRIIKSEYRRRWECGDKILFIPPVSSFYAVRWGDGELFHPRTCCSSEKKPSPFVSQNASWEETSEVVRSESQLNEFGEYYSAGPLIDYLYQSRLNEHDLKEQLKDYVERYSFQIT